MSIDFQSLNARLLAQAPTLIPQWMPNGKREGREYVLGGLDGSPGRSLSINLFTGVWKDFAEGQGGSDLISLYAALHNMGQAEAARELGAPETEYRPAVSAPATDPVDPEDEPAPMPEAAPEYAAPPPLEHPRYGISTGQWAYRDAVGAVLCWVYRFDPEGSRKQFVPHTWMDGLWVSKAPAKPRPLYGLDRLAARPERPILICEGERATDAAAGLFPGMVAMSWLGGAAAVNTADWTVLAGRDCLIWPDNDDPGRQACAKLAGFLLSLKCRVRVINPDGQADGWDAADWEGSTADLKAWLKPRIIPVERAVDAVPRPVIEGQRPAPGGAVTLEHAPAPDSAYAVQQALGLEMNGQGRPHANLSNAILCIKQRADECGVRLWYDEFMQTMLWAQGDDRGKPWGDIDTINLTSWMQSRMKLASLPTHIVRDAVVAYAFANKRNECREWLESLAWDGMDRLAGLLPVGFGSERNDYTEAVGRCFMVGMVARVIKPGCKVDTLPVFEGPQGSFKSTALRILGGKYFSEIHEQIGTKDFLQCIQGMMLLEISELSSFRKSEIERIKSTISNCDDRFRAPYAREPASHPRQCVFAGTTNRTDWIADDTGARRFWPVLCGEIDRDWLSDSREQLFSEAVARFKRGESWYDVPAEHAEREQGTRQLEDVWDDHVAAYMKGKPYSTVADVLELALGIEPSKMTRADQMRVGSILRRQGWERAQMRVGGDVRKVWRVAQKKAPRP
jgi:predicted P-loop ATPase